MKGFTTMKKITLIALILAMLSMGVCAHASEGDISVVSETSSMVKIEVAKEVVAERETTVEPELETVDKKNAPGVYDDKYYYDWEKWQNNYEYEVECWLGIKTNPLVEGKYGINPKRTEPWWDEWIEEMLSEGLIDQAWYDEMIEKGYIIEVD